MAHFGCGSFLVLSGVPRLEPELQFRRWLYQVLLELRYPHSQGALDEQMWWKVYT